MCRIRRPVRAVAGDVLGHAVRKLEVVERPAEHLEGCEGLVVGHLVTGLVHSEEREVAELAHFAVLLAVDHEWLVARSAELGGVSVI